MLIFKKNELPHNSQPIVFTFGRFNPITKGHAKLFREVLTTARKINANHLVFCSKTHDNDRNPLGFTDKVTFLNTLFPVVNFMASSSIRSPFEAIEWLSEHGYRNVVMVVGDDRIDEFKKRINKYIENKNPKYDFENFFFVSAGVRDENSSDSEESVSASKARRCVKNNNFTEFRKCLPSYATKQYSIEIYDVLRKELMGK